MKLSVIMPVYSETESVRLIVEDITQRLRPHLHEVILIVSPRSSGASLTVCRALAERPGVRMLMQSERPGFGQAYREAFPQATGDAVLMLDADGEFDLSSILPMIAAIEGGADAAIACRWMPGGGVEGYGVTTYLANRAFQLFLRLLFRTRLRDLTFGFKMLKRDVVRVILWEGTMHELAMETTLKPLRFGYRIVEVSSFWRKRREGESKNSGLWWRARRYVPLAIKILRTPPQRLVTCPLCAGARSRVLGERGIVAKDGPLVPVRNALCLGCGLVFQHPQPDPATLERRARAYTESRHGFETPEALARHLATLNLRGKAGGIREFLGADIRSGSHVLEIGCGAGGVLEHLRDEVGCVVEGVEPSSVAAELARRSGVPVFVGTLDEYLASAPKTRFDAVLLHHVLEHLPDPIGALEALRDLLAPRGIVCIEVPDVARFTKPVDQFFDAMHLWNFTPGTLRRLLARAGYKVIRRNEKKRFRIQVIAASFNHPAPEVSFRVMPTISPSRLSWVIRLRRVRDAVRAVLARQRG